MERKAGSQRERKAGRERERKAGRERESKAGSQRERKAGRERETEAGKECVAAHTGWDGCGIGPQISVAPRAQWHDPTKPAITD